MIRWASSTCIQEGWLHQGEGTYLWTNKADDLHDAPHEVLILTRVRHGQGIKELAKQCREVRAQI